MLSVALEPMTDAQFGEFIEVIVPPYVAERVQADHLSPEDAQRFVRDQQDRLLPDGRQTPGHQFLRIVTLDIPQCVGGVWLEIDSENKQGFLYNLTVFPPYRRRRFGSDALALVAELVRRAGCGTLGLNVFSTNDAAVALYRKMGFSTVSSYMNKKL